MLTVVHDAESANEDGAGSRSLLDEIVRDGARQMLAAALRAEVSAYAEQFADQLDDNGRRLVVLQADAHLESATFEEQRILDDHARARNGCYSLPCSALPVPAGS